MHTPELVLLGGPASGKTHYAGQLYGRLQRRPGSKLTLRPGVATPRDLSALEAVLYALAEGHAAGHTHANQWAEVLLPLQDAKNKALDVRWPDYGGEQLKQVLEARAVTPAWRDRLRQADGWVLMIRLSQERTYPDALEQLTQRVASGSASISSDRIEWDANAKWIETLQLLLHVAGLGTVRRLQRPRLVVVLSCYDELNAPAGGEPVEQLRAKLPLLWAFLQSVWRPENLSVWGVSALGKTLDKDSADEDFMDAPENQGWVVAPSGGERNSDLTLPLAWLLESVA